ncbi:MAG TPA: nitroreductase family protein [Spirochaetia bacterium]|nr:nitroreductase family protein [Spirochaetia bacterium]
MNFYELIAGRESIRDYDPQRPVNPAVLDRILEAGRLAPSAANRQPWRFFLVSSKKMLEKVRPCYPTDWFQNAPHILVVLGKEDEAWRRSSDSYCALQTDLAIAMDHMILAAENEGVGTCWIAAFKPDILYRALSVRENERIFTITPLGYPKRGFVKKGSKQRKPFGEVVTKL